MRGEHRHAELSTGRCVKYVRSLTAPNPFSRQRATTPGCSSGDYFWRARPDYSWRALEPFASGGSFFGLTKLSVWWLRLGIGIERIKPGNPQQNGRHQRMHLTLKKEATKPAAKNFLQQQGKFDRFIEEYNHDRPHQALSMKYPSELYTPSPRPYRGLREVSYPFHDRTIIVTGCGRICIGKRKINLSQAFAGQTVGVTEVSEKIWLVSFMDYDLGFFDHQSGRVECAENPFSAKHAL